MEIPKNKTPTIINTIKTKVLKVFTVKGSKLSLCLT